MNSSTDIGLAIVPKMCEYCRKMASTREQLEEFLNSMRDDPDWSRIPKPRWYVEKYKVLAAPKKNIVQLTSYAFSPYREYTTRDVEVRDSSGGSFPELPPVEDVVKVLPKSETVDAHPPETPPALEDSTGAIETKTPESESPTVSSPPWPCGGAGISPDA